MDIAVNNAGISGDLALSMKPMMRSAFNNGN